MFFDRMLAKSADIFPRGVLVLELQPGARFSKEGVLEEGQDTDEKTGLAVWNFKGIDVLALDRDEREKRGLRGSPEVKLRLLMNAEPVIPQAKGLGSIVEFEGLMVTPYLDRDTCDTQKGQVHRRCKGQLKYSLRATGIKPFRA